MRLVRPYKSLSSVIVNCDPTDTFTTLWRKVFVDLIQDGRSLSDLYANREIGPDDVRRALSTFDLTTTPIVILDEFDKLSNPNDRTLIANTIKALSDYSVHTTLILVGVSSSVDGLIKEHESIVRALIQIQMPRMDASEIQEIVEKRLSKVGMRISRAALLQLTSLSRGLPHYAHLLGLESAKRAIGMRKLLVDDTHMSYAEKECLSGVDQTIRAQYHKATQSPRGGNIYREVLLGCALAEPDELGFFPAKAVEAPLSIIMGKHYDVPKFGQHLKKLCEPDRGCILEVMGSARRFRYRFVEPIMQPYIILRGQADGLIDKERVEGLTPSVLQPRLSNEF